MLLNRHEYSIAWDFRKLYRIIYTTANMVVGEFIVCLKCMCSHPIWVRAHAIEVRCLSFKILHLVDIFLLKLQQACTSNRSKAAAALKKNPAQYVALLWFSIVFFFIYCMQYKLCYTVLQLSES